MKNCCETVPKKLQEFKDVTDAVIKYLNDNFHPHTKIIIDTNRAEVVEGVMAIKNDRHIKD